MCSTVNMLCCAFQNQIVDLTSPSQFYVHSIKITDIRVRDKYTLQDEDTPTCKYLFSEPEKDVEINSLNTSLSDIKCEKALECVAEKYGFEADIVNLDSPGISQTQIAPNYDDARLDVGVQEDVEKEEGEEEEEGEDEGEEGESETEEEETDEGGTGKKGKRAKKGKKSGGKGGGKVKGKTGKKSKKEKMGKGAKDKRGEGAKDKKGKEEKEKSKKDKNKKDRQEKEKDEKSKKQKENKENDEEGEEKKKKEKTEKEKKEKGKKEKRKEAKEKKEKGKKGKEGKEGKEKSKEGKGKEEDEGVGDSNEDEGTDESWTTEEEKDKHKDEDKDKSKENSQDMDKGIRRDEESESSISSLEERELSEFEEEELPPDCLPNSYPGYTCVARNLTVVGSESGNYESLCNLLKTGFKCADRILVMTPWGNYVVFRSLASYLLYDGCTCNVNRFRHLDLTAGTAGLLCFRKLHDLIVHIVRGKGNKSDKKLKCEQKYLDQVIDDICEEYCK